MRYTGKYIIRTVIRRQEVRDKEEEINDQKSSQIPRQIQDFSYIIIGNGIGNSGGSVVYSDSTG